MKRQIFVNLGLVLVLALIGWVCFTTGKAYKIVFENVPYVVDGKEEPALEALQVTIDQRKDPLYLLEDDRMVGTVVGKTHSMLIELLDEDDRVTESRTVSFSIEELGDRLEINVPRAWATGKM